MTDSEVYIYLGSMEDCLIFSHTIYDENKYNSEIGGQIYNCMIDKKIIKDELQKIIVFELYPSLNKTKVLIIEHGKHRTVFYNDDLGMVYPLMINKEKNESIFVINYLYNQNCYVPCEVPMEIPKISIKPIDIDDIEYIVTIKPLN